MSGYHLVDIKRGIFGEASKIYEEVEEFKDALNQQNRLMALLELADLIGAIEAYALENGCTLSDLLIMMEATKRAFKDGTRESRETSSTTALGSLAVHKRILE